MDDMDTRWFTNTLADRHLSQRRLAKLLGCDPASVNRLVHGKRALRFDEAEQLAVFLGVDINDVLSHSGIPLEQGNRHTRLVGYIDGAGEAHIDWGADNDTVPILPDLPPQTVALQYRTAMTAREPMDGWVIYVEPPPSEAAAIGRAMHRCALVCLDSGITVLGFLRRGYEAGRYNVINVMGPTLENVGVKWAAPVLLIRP